jgi:flagellar L-ring protein FlgH
MILQRIALAALVATLVGCAAAPIANESSEFMPSFPVAQPPAPVANGAIYQSGGGLSWFGDRKALQVGDLLTVQLIEETRASKSASANSKKSSELDLPIPNLFNTPLPQFQSSLGSSNEFKGEGGANQSNSIRGSITVFVSDVLPNGNLVIRGEKRLSLNQGEEYVRLTGVVRRVDISPSNTIESTKIANAQIAYGGRGAIADASRMGWIQRFFNSGYWPF